MTEAGLTDAQGRTPWSVMAEVDGGQWHIGWASPVEGGWKGTTYAPEPPLGHWTGRVDAGTHRAAVLSMLRRNGRTCHLFGLVPAR